MTQTMAMRDTRNEAWVNNKSKFGYKMLEKMGWSEGKGLGAKENGMTSHVRIRRKTSNAGIGGEKKLDDWNKPAQVAAGLNAVLSRLAPVNSKKVIVEEQRGNVKGRGYHQRRSAGKNVGAYSETDLREIFGGVNVNRNAEDDNNQKDDQETDPVVKNQRSGEGANENEKGRYMKPKRDRDLKRKRKMSREENVTISKREDLAAKPTIRKLKKSKKRRREA